MNEHQLKTWPEPFKALWIGAKAHELRRDDRDFQVGDQLALAEYDPVLDSYSGRVVRAVVTYITRNEPQWGLMPGFCILSLGLILREG